MRQLEFLLSNYPFVSSSSWKFLHKKVSRERNHVQKRANNPGEGGVEKATDDSAMVGFCSDGVKFSMRATFV